MDRGCRADFEVAYRGGSQRSHHESHYGGNSSSYYSSGYHSGYRAGRHDDHRYYNDHYYDDDNGTDTAVAATAGAVVAAAVIAAAVKNHNKHKREETLAPSWATGRFSGYDPLAARDIDLSIYSGGAVQGLNSSFGLSGSWDGDRLHLGGREYDVTERGGGFVARDRRDSDHVIFFRRGG